jgi:hypothetical protein
MLLITAACMFEPFDREMVWLLALWVATAVVLVGGDPQQCPEKTVMADFNMTEVGTALR